MKAFILALLALPAALAAPTETPGSFTSLECTCVNPEGVQRSDGWCQYQRGDISNNYCHRAVAWAREMDQNFTDELCAWQYGNTWKGTCRQTTLCPAAWGPDYYVLC